MTDKKHFAGTGRWLRMDEPEEFDRIWTRFSCG